jgi:hypothetical protein
VFGDPETLRADLERMIEVEREGMRGDPERETKAWLEKLSEADRKRSAFQDMVADGLITFDELRAKLADLEETRAMAQRELECLRHRREHLDSLERNKVSVLEDYAALAPEALHSLTPEERHRLYKMLKLRVTLDLDGSLEVSGALVDDLAVGQAGALSPWSPSAAADLSAGPLRRASSSRCASSASRPGLRRSSSSYSPTSG